MNIKIGKGGNGSINCNKGGIGKLIEKKYIDLGVINVYNTALSQSEISQFYENFRYKYE